MSSEVAKLAGDVKLLRVITIKADLESFTRFAYKHARKIGSLDSVRVLLGEEMPTVLLYKAPALIDLL